MHASSPIDVRMTTSNPISNRRPTHRSSPCHLLTSLFSSSKSFFSLSPTSPPGVLTSSLVSPSPPMRLRKPSSEMSSWVLVSMTTAVAYMANGSTHQLVFLSAHVRDVHIVGRRAKFFEFSVVEDVDRNQMNLGVTVLSGLGCRHFDDLAGTTFDDHEAALPQGRALHRISRRRASVGRLEGMLMLRVTNPQSSPTGEDLSMRKQKNSGGGVI